MSRFRGFFPFFCLFLSSGVWAEACVYKGYTDKSLGEASAPFLPVVISPSYTYDLMQKPEELIMSQRIGGVKYADGALLTLKHVAAGSVMSERLLSDKNGSKLTASQFFRLYFGEKTNLQLDAAVQEAIRVAQTVNGLDCKTEVIRYSGRQVEAFLQPYRNYETSGYKVYLLDDDWVHLFDIQGPRALAENLVLSLRRR